MAESLRTSADGMDAVENSRPGRHGGLDAVENSRLSAGSADFRGQHLGLDGRSLLKTLGKVLPAKDEQRYASLVLQAQGPELAASEAFDVYCPVADPTITKTITDTRRASTWKVIYGKANGKARLTIEGFQDLHL